MIRPLNLYPTQEKNRHLFHKERLNEILRQLLTPNNNHIKQCDIAIICDNLDDVDEVEKMLTQSQGNEDCQYLPDSFTALKKIDEDCQRMSEIDGDCCRMFLVGAE